MSSTTLANLDIASEKDLPLSSGSLTPVRKSFENVNDQENQLQQDDADNPPPLSTMRLTLLMLGLSLSMFLVALDFVSPPANES